MPWLTPYREPTLAELAGSGSISGGGGISAALLRPPPNQWEQALAQVLPAIKEYIQRKKSDEIANQLQNMYQPPRAEAVDPRSYNQLLAAEQGLMSERAPQATMPFTGGADQFQVAEMYRKSQQEAEDRELKRRQVEAQINAKGESRVPIQIDGETYHVTPNAALEHFDRVRRNRSGDVETRFNKDAEKDYGLTADDISRIRADQIDFYDASGNVLTQEKVNENPKDVWVIGKAGDKTVRVPYSDWVKLATRYQNLPKRESNPAAESYRGVQQQGPETRWDSVPTINTKEERDALPSGTVYIGPDGKKHRKP